MVSEQKRSPIRDAAANHRDSPVMFSLHGGRNPEQAVPLSEIVGRVMSQAAPLMFQARQR
jgi:hypothetical protein